MARAREPTISECLFTVLLFALIHTIAAQDAAVVRYEERLSEGVVVETSRVRARRQAPVTSTTTTTVTITATTPAPPPDNGTEPVRTPGNGTTKNETGVTNAPTTPGTTPSPTTTTTTSTPTQAPTVGTTPGQLPSTTANVTISENDVKYYTVTTIRHQTRTVQKYWKDLAQGSEVHPVLSDGHRLAQTLPLKFKFRFYGHTITNVTIATGGFLYMSPFLHKFLTATQYIAPLMANFDTSLGNESHIRYLSTSEIFIVQWENVHLKDQVEFGIFNFQVHLKKSGDILFVYRNVPISVTEIVEDNHPVKVGLSDAFYIDKDDKKLGMKRRTIYEYHRVQINFTQVTNNTVVILKPNPTCNTAQTCETCLDNLAAMGCRWCGIVGRCSDGIDWKRQDWLDKGCKYLSTKNKTECDSILTKPSTKASTASATSASTATTKFPSLSTRSSSVTKTSVSVPPKFSSMTSLSSLSRARASLSSLTRAPTSLSSLTLSPTSLSSLTRSPTSQSSLTRAPTSSVPVTKSPVSLSSTSSAVSGCTFAESGNDNCSSIVTVQPTKAPLTRRGDNMGFPPGAVIAIIIIVALVIGIGGWLFYAYRNPTSPSGMWLIQHRPDAMKTKLAKMKFWKQSTPTGDKYSVESEA